MSEILLVNPRRRRRKKAATRKRRTSSARRRNPVVRRKRAAVAVKRHRRNLVARRRVSRRRRNPIKMGQVQNQLRVAGMGAAGALGLDIALAYIPLPAMLKGGIVGKLTKGFGAVALGMVAHRFMKVSAANATRLTEGALTVQLHGIGRELLGQFAPGVALSAYLNDEAESLGYAGSGWNPSRSLDWSDGSEMSAYLSPGMNQQSFGADMDAGATGYGY